MKKKLIEVSVEENINVKPIYKYQHLVFSLRI